VASADLESILAPRSDALLAERPTDEPGVFALDQGPFDTYSRTVEWEPAGATDIRVTEQYRFRIAAPVWRPLLSWPLRRALRRGPVKRPPWWAPPDRFDASTTRSVSLLALAAVITGYLGALIGQTATFAADEFDATDRAQGILLAAARAGTVITLAVLAAADRRGRRRMLVFSLLLGSAVTLLGAASTGLVSLGVSQAVARGFATAITLLVGIMAAEVVPRRSRAYAAAVLTLCAGLGAGIPVWFLFVADLDPRGWRLLYLIAALFVPASIWIARHLTESSRYREHMSSIEAAPVPAAEPAFATAAQGAPSPQDEAPRGATGAIRRDRLIAVAAVAFLVLMFAAPATQFRNEFLRDERGFTAAQVSLFVIVTNTPQGIGVALAGKLADRRGRKPVAAVTVGLGALLTVLVYVSSGATMWVVAIFAGLVASGAAPALGVYSAELFGTGGRGRANGLISLVAVAGSATGLVLVGSLSDRFGDFGDPFAIVALGPLLVVAIVLLVYPESAGRELEELNPEHPPGPAVPDGGSGAA
jgi:MFS family permease